MNNPTPKQNHAIIDDLLDTIHNGERHVEMLFKMDHHLAAAAGIIHRRRVAQVLAIIATLNPNRARNEFKELAPISKPSQMEFNDARQFKPLQAGVPTQQQLALAFLKSHHLNNI